MRCRWGGLGSVGGGTCIFCFFSEPPTNLQTLQGRRSELIGSVRGGSLIEVEIGGKVRPFFLKGKRGSLFCRDFTSNFVGGLQGVF